MSDTPETDAVFIWEPFLEIDVNKAQKLCEKLERERDEARDRERVAWKCFDEERQRASREFERVLEARRERDEAQEKAERYRLETNAIMMQRDEARAERDILRSNKMSDPLLETTFKHLIRERDEAREVNAKLRDIAEDERIDMAQQLESKKQCHDRCQNERDALVQKLDAWEEIAEHLHHLVQHPAYGVDQAIRRMDVLEAYKHLKNGH